MFSISWGVKEQINNQDVGWLLNGNCQIKHWTANPAHVSLVVFNTGPLQCTTPPSH